MTLEAVLLRGVMPVLVLAALLVVGRLVKGPSVPDRVVALDLLSTIGIGLAAAYAVATRQFQYLDVAIVLALLSFLGTVAFAYYVERSRS